MLIKAKVCLRSGVLSTGGQMSSIAAKKRAKRTRTILDPEPPVPLDGKAWARGPGGSGDTGFEVLEFRTSVHFWFSTTFVIAFTCCCRSVNDCKFRWFQAFKRESSNLLLNRKWPEVLKSRTSNPVSPVCLAWDHALSLLSLYFSHLVRPWKKKKKKKRLIAVYSLSKSLLVLVLRPRRLKEQEALGTRMHLNESCLYPGLLAALTLICALDN